jgi:glycosyltransferase involved in cell wall biosynthesis
MRIAIDGTAPVIGGGITWLREMVPALCAASPEDTFWLFLRSDMLELKLRAPTNCNHVWIMLPPKARVIGRLVWQQVVLPLWLYKIKADVLLAPYDIAPIFAPCKVVLGIQNASPYYGLSPSNWLGRRRLQLLRWLTKISAWRADKVFFVSEWSRQAISRKLRLPLQKSHVIYHGVSDRFQPREKKPAEQFWGLSPYVLVVGSVCFYKDYITLIKAWKIVVTNMKQYIKKLLIVGPILESQYYQKLISLADDLKINESVSFVSSVPPSEMPALYQGASTLIMPSYTETFGLPMLEAMACGIPVIASDIPVAREICGEAACYYRLGDPEDLAEKLIYVLKDTDKRSELIKSGKERAQHFSWDKSAVRLLQLLRDAL